MIPIIGIGALILLILAISKTAKAEAFEKPPSPPRDDIDEAIEKESKKVEALRVTSPLDGVSDTAWAKFVKVFATGSPGTISPNYYLGIFSYGMRRLEDLGLAKDVRKQDYNGRMVWKGDWTSPYSLEDFLGSEQLQHDTFARDMKIQAKVILSRHRDELGKEHAGSKATLSGLLAVAKQAGLGGLSSWLTVPADKEKFPNTTKAYIRANGIF